MEQNVFIQLSAVLVLATLVSFVMRLLKQPLIMGYILTGILVGPALLGLMGEAHMFESFSEIGIALLLFIIGLGLNAGVIKSLGKVVVFVAAAILLAVGSMGYLVGSAFGYSYIEALIIGLVLFFSSTIIILKVLSDKREQTRLYGQLAIGVILVDDIVATFGLLFVAGAGEAGGLSVSTMGWLIAKGAVLAGVLIFVSGKILPKLSKMFASSQELLFLFAIAWGFGIASLFEIIGFSLEVGALFAGVSLASLAYSSEMAARLKPLRDFFIVIFFISLGENLGLGSLMGVLIPALVLSLVVIIGKPLFVMAALGVLGYTKRTSFKAGIHLSQISEFSIILVIIAASNNVISGEIVSLITLVALITITVSTYMMYYDEFLFTKLENSLKLFERRVVHEDKKIVNSYPLVLFGYRKGGHEFVRTFKEMKKKFVIVDYSPDVIETLQHQRLPYIYGDATDLELLDEINIGSAKLIVSTITDYEINSVLVKHIHHINPRAVMVCHADNYDEAAELYEHGATYVMLPHFIGSERISSFIRRRGTSKEAFERYREKHLISLGRAAIKSRH